VIPNPVELSNAFTQIAKQVEPSVVNVSVTYAARPDLPPLLAAAGRSDEEGENGGGMDDFFRRFMNPFGGEGPEMPGGEGKRSVPAWWWMLPATFSPTTTWWTKPPACR
jgi:S1-C subfamily serine protease